MRITLLACLLLLIASTAMAEPILSGAIQVIDGDRPARAGALSVPELNGFHDTVFQEDITMILVD